MQMGKESQELLRSLEMYNQEIAILSEGVYITVQNEQQILIKVNVK